MQAADYLSLRQLTASSSLMPAIAYVLDMYHRTNGAYGVNEVILASALAAIVFPIFSVQPLTFVGVTGLINLVSTAIKVTHWKAKAVPRLIAASGSCTLLSPKSAFVAFRCVVEVVGRVSKSSTARIDVTACEALEARVQ